MSNRAPENLHEKSSAALSCESCGAIFDCGANVGECWCFKVAVKPETLANLRARYENCLCAGCLSKLAESRDEKFSG